MANRFLDTLDRLQRNDCDDRVATVLGLGRSGVETALFLRRCGIAVFTVEDASRESFAQKDGGKAQKQLLAAGTELLFEPKSQQIDSLVQRSDLCVVSPGVPFDACHVEQFKKAGVSVTNDLELGLQIAGKPYILVTGSNGKTTTVSLLQHILRNCGVRSRLVGNVGMPLLAELSSAAPKVEELPDWYVVEASSFQIESSQQLSPQIGVFLNLSENHLDRHQSVENYFEIKSRAFQSMAPEALFIGNGDDPYVRKLANDLSCQVSFFGSELYDELPDCALIGKHNRYNISAALQCVAALGISSEAALPHIATFEPIPHRFELVCRTPITVINDSKSTTVAATVAAVSSCCEAFPNRPVWLLVGGRDKGGDWGKLRESLEQLRKVSVVLFGEASDLVATALDSLGDRVVRAQGALDAARFAWNSAEPGDAILLSPGGSSYDEFTNFEERGDMFKSLVNDELLASQK